MASISAGMRVFSWIVPVTRRHTADGIHPSRPSNQPWLDRWLQDTGTSRLDYAASIQRRLAKSLRMAVHSACSESGSVQVSPETAPSVPA